jgi:hypothetical protein
VTRLVIDLELCSNYVAPASFRRPRLLTEDRAYFEPHGECNDESRLEIRDERRERGVSRAGSFVTTCYHFQLPADVRIPEFLPQSLGPAPGMREPSRRL